MTIAEFAQSINSCQPSMEQIKAHLLRVDARRKDKAAPTTSIAYTMEQLEKRKSEMIFMHDIDKETGVPEEKLYQLIKKTNIHWQPAGFQWNPPGALSFYNEIEKSKFIDDGLEFAVCNEPHLWRQL